MSPLATAFGLVGPRALVTGGSRGIGLAKAGADSIGVLASLPSSSEPPATCSYSSWL